MKIIHTDKAPAAVGPYSQATEVNGLIYRFFGHPCG
jgi:2-iminobutanoate/2-iminopropanoate deaminase